MASDGRALTVDSAVEDQLGEEDPVVEVGDLHLLQLTSESGDDVGEQVVRQGSRRLDTLLGVGDGGGLDRADPDGQVALTVALAQQHDGLVRRHLDPDADHVDWLHDVSLLRIREVRFSDADPGPAAPSPARRAAGRVSAASARVVSSARPWASAPRPRIQRGHHLLDEPGLAVGGRLERAQVARLDAVRRAARRPPWRPPRRRRRSARPCGGADQPVALQRGQQVVVDLGCVEQLVAATAAARTRHARSRRPRGSRRHARPTPGPAAWHRARPAARARGRSLRGARGSPSAAGTGHVGRPGCSAAARGRRR